MGFNRVILEGDWQVFIRALKEDGIFLCTDSLFIEEVRSDARFFNELCYSHVKREGNKIAHSLARYTFEILDFVVWVEDVPPLLFYIVQVDIHGFINKKFKVCFLNKKKKKRR